MRVTPRSRTNRHRALSARQAQIAALIARGKPNREIACALFLSQRTVDAHLAAIFNKLDVTSRTELAVEFSISEADDPVVMPPETSFSSRATRSARSGRSAGQALSVRQAEIAILVSRGKSNREIAFTLGRSPRTIEAHLVAIFRKLNVRSRGELIAALTLGHSHPAVVPTSLTISKLPARPVPVPPRWELQGFSMRQTEVAALAATGKSNREIGDDLMLSSRTVATHVMALMNKLKVSSRGELIAALNRQNDSVAQSHPQPNCAATRKLPASATSAVDSALNRQFQIADTRWYAQERVDRHSFR